MQLKSSFLPFLICFSFLIFFTKNTFSQGEITSNQNQDSLLIEKLYQEGISFSKQKKYYDGILKLEEALHLVDSVYNGPTLRSAQFLLDKGVFHYYAVQYDLALDSWFQSRELFKEKAPENIKKVQAISKNIAAGYRVTGQYDLAESTLNKVLEYNLKTYGDTSNEVAESYSNLGRFYRRSRQFKKALEVYEKATTIYDGLEGEGNLESASIYSFIGIIHHQQGQYDQALGYYKKSLKIQSTELDSFDINLDKTHESIGITYYSMGNPARSLEHFKHTLAIRLKNYGEKHTDLVSCYINISSAYNTMGNWPKANEYNEKALNLSRDILGDKHYKVGKILLNNGFRHLKKRNLKKAKICLDQSYDIFKANFKLDAIEFARLYNVFGNYYTLTGDYEKAINYHSESLKIKKDILGETHNETAISYQNLGITYGQLKEYNKALENFILASGITSVSIGDTTIQKARIHINISALYSDQDSFSSSIHYLNKGLKIYLSLFIEGNSEIGSIYSNLGNIYYKQKKYSLAKNTLHKALTYKKINIPNPPVLASTYNNLAKIYVAENNLDSAFHYIYLSLKTLNYSGIGSLHKAHSINELVNTLKVKSSIHHIESKDLNTIADSYSATIQAIKHQIASTSNESKFALVSDINSITNKLIAINLSLYKETKDKGYKIRNFSLGEQSKAILLNSAFQESNALFFAGIPDSLIQAEYDYRIDLTSIDKQIQERVQDGFKKSDPEILDISTIRFDLNRKYENLKSTLEEEYPDYYKAKYDLSTISIFDVQKNLLTANQSLIEYVTGDSNSYILLVNRDTFFIHEISKNIPLNDWVEQFRDGLTKYHTTKGMPKSMLSRLTKDYVRNGQQLYQELIAPIAPFLNQEVMIIPDGVLGYIPFEILLSQKPKDLSAFHNYPYFFKDHTISYCYSATLFQEMKNRKHRKAPIKQSLSIAPFFKGDIAATLARIDTLELVTLRSDTLQALPFSGEEAAKIAKITSGDHWLGTEATLDNFIKKAPDYRILHLSTHGIADDKVGDYAYLAFGNSNSQNQYEKLFIRDIYNIPLNADMVVLSACKTAYGKLQRGEGIISMARAFAYAGAKSIVTSHWSVDDQSTGIIMEYFYRELAKGFSKDKALQKAKLTYLENNKGLKAHPFYWAAFIGIGDMSKIDLGAN